MAFGAAEGTSADHQAWDIVLVWECDPLADYPRAEFQIDVACRTSESHVPIDVALKFHASGMPGELTTITGRVDGVWLGKRPD